MKFIAVLAFFSTICSAQESTPSDDSPRPPRLKIAYYSNSQLAGEEGQPAKFCEGKTDDMTLRGEKGRPLKFDDWSIKPDHKGEMPRMVALNAKFKAIGCTFTFTSGPLAGQHAIVGELNRVDTTVSLPLDTRSAKTLTECQALIRKGEWLTSPPVTFELTGPCEGAKIYGPKPASAQNNESSK